VPLFAPLARSGTKIRVYFSISEKTAKNNKDNQQEKVVPHIPGQLNNDLYAVPVKKKNQKCPEEIEIYSPDKESADDTDLPPGWEKHEGKK
jgi:hypothetical protein